MRIRSGFRPCLVSFLVAASCSSLVAEDNGRLHLVIAVDTLDRTIGSSVQYDYDRLYHLFYYAVPAHRQGPFTMLTGQHLTKAGLLQAIRNRNVSPDDALLVYYAGHGSYKVGEHGFNLHNKERVERAEVTAAMEATGARLKLFFYSLFSHVLSWP